MTWYEGYVTAHAMSNFLAKIFRCFRFTGVKILDFPQCCCPWPWYVLEDKFWVLGLGLEQKSLALANQVLGLVGLVIFPRLILLQCYKKHFHRMNDSTVNSQSVLTFSFYQTYISQSGLLLRPHRARMSDIVLETLVFLSEVQQCCTAARVSLT